MQHLRTASSCQASNEASVTRTPLSHKSLPNLPFEVIRRIIHHRLALPDSVPDAIPLSPTSGSTERWDDLAGHAGRLSAKEKQKERREVMRDAGGMMLVCKAWKPIVMRYLYRSPPLTASSLLLLTESVLRGDKKWDDTRLHPHSIPGRYVRTLDLSTISLTMTDFGDDFEDESPGPSSYSSSRHGARMGNKGPSPHVTAIARACAALMPLLPNVTHLKLPPVGGGPAYEAILDTIWRAPFVSRLRAVEGLQVPGGGVGFRRQASRVPSAIGNDQSDGDADGDGPIDRVELDWRPGVTLLRVLSKMRNLEYLSLSGQGLGADTWPPGSAEATSSLEPLHSPFPLLDLPALHTIRLDSLPTSPLLGILASSVLPSLTRLLITSYTPVPLSPALANTNCPDLTLALFQSHGHALRSLTLLPTREWPPVYPLPPDEVFERYCPELRHVSILLPMAAFSGDKEGAARLGRVLARRGSRVERVTVAKWAQRSGGSPSPSPAVHTVPLPNGHAGHLAGGPDPLVLGGLTIHADGQSREIGKKLAPLPKTHPFLSSLITSAAANASHASSSSDHALAIEGSPSVPTLQTITIDGLTSVSPHLSFAARDAGANGEMRSWAIGMAQRSIEMLDGTGRGVLSQYHALCGISEGAGAGANAGGPLGLGSPGQRYGLNGASSPSIGGSYNGAVGSWGDLSPIAAAVAAGSGMGMRRSSAGEWDERGRRRSRGGAMQGMSGFGIQIGLGGYRHRGEGDEDDGG